MYTHITINVIPYMCPTRENRKTPSRSSPWRGYVIKCVIVCATCSCVFALFVLFVPYTRQLQDAFTLVAMPQAPNKLEHNTCNFILQHA